MGTKTKNQRRSKPTAAPRRARGPRVIRGPAGPQGLRGPVGPPGPTNHRYDALAEKVEAISKELKIQFERFSQIQLQLDGVAQALKQIESQRAATERLTTTAEREVTAKPPN